MENTPVDSTKSSKINLHIYVWFRAKMASQGFGERITFQVNDTKSVGDEEEKKNGIVFFDHMAMRRLEINYKKKTAQKHKHVETKQYATKQPMDHWRSQRGNKKNT